MDRGWGDLPPISLITQRHSGSHSALNILEQHWMRHYLTEDWRKDDGVTKPPVWFSHSEPEKMSLIQRRIAESEVLILTMRDPIDVAVSWIKRGRPLNRWFKAIWFNLFKLQAEHKGMWLPVDTPDRDDYLRAISERVGMDIKTDWEHKGVTTHRQYWQSGMTLSEVAAFYETLPFEQFGYPNMKKAAKKKTTKKPVSTFKHHFRFTGDPVNGQDPEKIRFFGYLFTLNGRKVGVTDEVAAQLSKNSHFTEV